MSFNEMKRLFSRITKNSPLYWYSAGSLASSILGTLGGFLIIAWVPPKELGIWRSVLILQSYVALLHVGVVHGLNRELPFLMGKGTKEYIRAASTAQAFSFGVASFLALGALASLFLPLNIKVKYSLFAVFMISSAGILINYLSVVFRAAQEFEIVGKISFAVAFAGALGLALVRYWGFWGIPLRLILISVCQLFLLLLFKPLKVPFDFNVKVFGSLLKVGVPLYASGCLIQLALTFPNTILLIENGAEAVGLFAPAMAAFGLMMMLPKSIGQYVYAKMSFRLGRTDDPKTLWPYAWKSSMGLVAVSLPIIAVATFLAPYMIHRFYPKYVECLSSIFWMLLAGTLFGAQMFGSAFRSLKAWKWLWMWTGLRLSLSFILPFLGYRIFLKDHFWGVSIGYACAGLVSFISGLYMAFLATYKQSGFWAAEKLLSVAGSKE